MNFWVERHLLVAEKTTHFRILTEPKKFPDKAVQKGTSRVTSCFGWFIPSWKANFSANQNWRILKAAKFKNFSYSAVSENNLFF